jgi:hypothetical protein
VAPSLLHVRAFRSATGPSVHATAQPEPPRLPGAAAVRARPQPRSPKPSRCPPLGSATRAHAIARSTRTIARCGSRGSRLPSPLATGCRVRGGIGEPERIPRLGANCVNVEDCGPQRWGPRRCRVVEHQPETSPRGDPLPLSRFIAPFAPSAAGAPTASAARGPRRSMNPAVGGRGRLLFIGLGGGPARCRGDGERRAVSRSWGPTGRRSSASTIVRITAPRVHPERSSTANGFVTVPCHRYFKTASFGGVGDDRPAVGTWRAPVVRGRSWRAVGPGKNQHVEVAAFARRCWE